MPDLRHKRLMQLIAKQGPTAKVIIDGVPYITSTYEFDFSSVPPASSIEIEMESTASNAAIWIWSEFNERSLTLDASSLAHMTGLKELIVDSQIALDLGALPRSLETLAAGVYADAVLRLPNLQTLRLTDETDGTCEISIGECMELVDAQNCLGVNLVY